MKDFYEGITEDTAHTLGKMMLYVNLALKNGDVIYLENGNKLVITIPKKKTSE